MFFLVRYKNEYEDLSSTISEMQGWSFVVKRKSILRKIVRHILFDDNLEMILKTKIKFILNDRVSDLKINDVCELNDFFRRKAGCHKEIVKSVSRSEGLTLSICEENISNEIITNHYEVLSLIEAIIVFAKTEKIREKTIKEFEEIFKENGNAFCIRGFQIINNDDYSLRHRLPLIREEKKDVKILLEKYYLAKDEKNYVECAKKAADLMIKIFPNKTLETYGANIFENAFNPGMSKPAKKEVLDDIKERVRLNKVIINKVFDIRHTEEYAVTVKDPYVYKMIANSCLDIITLYINGNKKKFFCNAKTASEVQKEYQKEYAKKELKEEDIAVEDIPF